MKIKISFSLSVIILWLGLINANCSLAGTSQIFSPSGLPRSSTQDYTIPEITVPTQTFPTPPIPMGDTSLQGFSSVPLKEELTINGTKPASSTANVNTTTIPAPTGSVESFFRCSPIPLTQEASSTNKNQPAAGSLGKLIWHTLDNIGVPLPTSKKGDLAPGLNQTYFVQPQQHMSSNAKPIYQKIPDSELGVTDIPVKDDAKLP
jgi:hypothetical protein